MPVVPDVDRHPEFLNVTIENNENTFPARAVFLSVSNSFLSKPNIGKMKNVINKIPVVDKFIVRD